MHRRTQEWLNEPNGFLERVGIPAGNVVFVSAISGRYGKGAAAAQLGLSHFVDNKWEVLESVFEDKAGNSGDVVQRFDGILFHFASGGAGRWRPKPPRDMSSDLGSHYWAVSGWSEVLERLRKDMSDRSTRDGARMLEKKRQGISKMAQQACPKEVGASVATVAPSMLVHRISVGIDEDVGFGVVGRLVGVDDENFKYITYKSGTKLILNGQGSTHPQPRSFEEEPLTICVRAKTNENLQEAVSLVEDLIRDVCQEYRKFQKALT